MAAPRAAYRGSRYLVPLFTINEQRTPYDHLEVNEAWAKRSATSVVVQSPSRPHAMTEAELLDRWQHLPGPMKRRVVSHVQAHLFDWKEEAKQELVSRILADPAVRKKALVQVKSEITSRGDDFYRQVFHVAACLWMEKLRADKEEDFRDQAAEDDSDDGWQ
eukprot:Rhum_TRINITY_DN15629_c0_g1::Rhum_TRINITY_DN15629_c0_g1_i1::g.161721::m.161721